MRTSHGRVAFRMVSDLDMTEKERRHGEGYTWVDLYQTGQRDTHLARVGMRQHFNCVQVHLEVHKFGPQSARMVRKSIDALREVFSRDSEYGSENIVVMFDVDPGEMHDRFMDLMGLNRCVRLYISTTQVAAVRGTA